MSEDLQDRPKAKKAAETPKETPAKKTAVKKAAPKKATAKKAAPAKKATAKKAPAPTAPSPSEVPAKAPAARKKAAAAPAQSELPLSIEPSDKPKAPRKRAARTSEPTQEPTSAPAPAARERSSDDAPRPRRDDSEASEPRREREPRQRDDRRDGRRTTDRRDDRPREDRRDDNRRGEDRPREERRSDDRPREERRDESRRSDDRPRNDRPDRDSRPRDGGGPSNRSDDAPDGGGDRNRKWNERKSKFKKWKEKRRSGRGGRDRGSESSTSGGGANFADNQAAEVPTNEELTGPAEDCAGLLELTPKGYGFLRQKSRSYTPVPQDPFVSPDLIRQFGLREGMAVKGKTMKGSRGPQVTEIAEVNGRDPSAMLETPLFEELKAVNPNKRIQLETVPTRLTTRVIDMMTPIGRGQRGLIVAPPRTGKTTLLQHVAEAIIHNHPQMHVILLLVDERPEEVTEFKRVLPTAEIFASSNDEDTKSHTRIAKFAIERAKRLVECGEHVFILMDSITRLARAFNNAGKGGATMSGGMGVGAMEIPRRLFAAARNTREAGSLTILATALIETGSRMDDLIFQEFKGTGNLELVLDRKIAEQFYYPAVNIFKSGTRREELLLQEFQLNKIHMLRRGLAGHKPIEALQRILSLLERYPSNAQMLIDLPSKS